MHACKRLSVKHSCDGCHVARLAQVQAVLLEAARAEAVVPVRKFSTLGELRSGEGPLTSTIDFDLSPASALPAKSTLDV